jgi:hypothetical protein
MDIGVVWSGFGAQATSCVGIGGAVEYSIADGRSGACQLIACGHSSPHPVQLGAAPPPQQPDATAQYAISRSV